jgi:hypothetical protein
MTSTEHGNREVALRGEILRTVVGSGVHGIAIAGTDDHDELGVFVEPPERVIGVGDAVDHYVHRTQPEGARSGPGDTDLVLYSLRRYLRLALNGNPTVLLPLYAPAGSVITMRPLGEELWRTCWPTAGPHCRRSRTSTWSPPGRSRPISATGPVQPDRQRSSSRPSGS